MITIKLREKGVIYINEFGEYILIKIRSTVEKRIRNGWSRLDIDMDQWMRLVPHENVAIQFNDHLIRSC